MSATDAIPQGAHHSAHRFPFLRHLLEMTLAMMVGMVVSAAVFLTAVGLTIDEALRQYAVSFVLVQAFGMTVTMVAWMRARGHGWRACNEMAAAMVVPAVVLIGLRLLDVISGPICSAYCAVTFLAMASVMVYRRSEYS
jgi:hypothetical protein